MKSLFIPLLFPAHPPLFKQYHKFAFIPFALPQPISIIRSSKHALALPQSISNTQSSCMNFAFIPFLFPAYLPYSSATLAHSLNSLLVGSCSPTHDCRWKPLSLRMDHSAIAAFGPWSSASRLCKPASW
jgi:hypothetical protein